MDAITVISPATVSNVVCGFDCLGFALEEPFDTMTVRRTPGRNISIVHLDDFGISAEPAYNVAGIALQAFIDAAELDHGFEVEITKGIRPGSGIGSSAASACGAVFAANEIYDGPFMPWELVEIAMTGELFASGSRHADNLAPCLYGGFTLVRSIAPLDIVELGTPELFATVIHPQIEIRTVEARALLPKEVPLKQAVAGWSNLGAFVAALGRADHELMARSMKDDIIEPARKHLIPHFEELRSASLAAGAIGGGISGSGPSCFMLSSDRTTADAVADAMSATFSKAGIDFNTYVSRVAAHGVRRSS